MRDNVERLKDIQDAIVEIEKYSVQGENAFRENELIQTWIIHHLQIVAKPLEVYLMILGQNIQKSIGVKLLILEIF